MSTSATSSPVPGFPPRRAHRRDDRLQVTERSDDGGQNYFVISAGRYDVDGTRTDKWDLYTGSHTFSQRPGGLIHDTAGGGTAYTPGLATRQRAFGLFQRTPGAGSQPIRY